MSVKLPVKELKTSAPFKDLFPIDDDVLEALTTSIKRDGFDSERPIFAWRKPDGSRVVVEGHMRLQAAKKARLKEVPVAARKFADEDTAFQFAIASQRDRRNLTKEEIATAIARAELARSEENSLTVREFSKGGRGKKNPVTRAVIEKSANAGVSKATAERGLANARAEKNDANPKPRKAAAKPPTPTVPELREALKEHQAAARELGPALTEFGKANGQADSVELERTYYAAVATLNAFGKKLTAYINDHGKEKASK